MAFLTRSSSRGSDFELAYASPIVSRAVLNEMGADPVSLQRHDSKKNLPRALDNEAGKPGDDGRKRRLNGSSDDEGKIAEDGFSNEDLRVGGPYLCSIPLSSRFLPETNSLHGLLEHEVSGEETIYDHVYKILRNRDISLIEAGPWDHPVTLSLRQSRYNPEPEPVPTIVILATRPVVNDLWLETARQIYFLLRYENFAQVSVEIVDPQALNPPKTLPVLKSDPMFNEWDSVLDHILTDVDLTDMKYIGCYRRGRNSGNENPVTFLVIADINSKKDWRGTRDEITGILKRSNLPMVAVEIVKDRNLALADFRKGNGFKEELLKGKAMAGGPIAHSSNDAGSGTLGGLIELQHPVTLKWYCFALTCFHVIDPCDEDLTGQEREAVLNWRSRGISMSNRDLSMSQQYLKISHPSQHAKQEQVKKHQEFIDYQKLNPLYQHELILKDNDLFDSQLTEPKKMAWQKLHCAVVNHEKKINDIQGFFHNSGNRLGCVRLASGFRSKKLHTLGDKSHPTNLDWALIIVDVEKRSPSNELEGDLALQEIASSEVLSRLSEEELSTWLEFQGYRSGRKKVMYNGLKIAKIENGEHTLEYSITQATGGHAAMAGDSGSLLCTPNGEVVGMIIAGLDYNPVAVFTRIDDLVKDIKEQTGAKDIRMWGT